MAGKTGSKSARAAHRRSVRIDRREVVAKSTKDISQFDRKQEALLRAQREPVVPVKRSRTRKLEDGTMISTDCDDEVKMQEFDDETIEKMKMKEKLFDDAAIYGVSLAVNKRVLGTKRGGGGGVNKKVITPKMLAHAQFFADPKFKKKQKRQMKNVERGVRANRMET